MPAMLKGIEHGRETRLVILETAGKMPLQCSSI
jgi:hypothetical protein